MQIHSSILIIFTLTLVISSCNKSDDPIPENDNFIFNANKNGETWTATSVWANYNKTKEIYTIMGIEEDPDYYQDEILSITITKSDIQIDKAFSEIEASLYYVVGGDAVSWRYINSESNTNNNIKIKHLNTKNNIISGEFEIELEGTRDKSGKIINMSNGEFSLTYNITE